MLPLQNRFNEPRLKASYFFKASLISLSKLISNGPVGALAIGGGFVVSLNNHE